MACVDVDELCHALTKSEKRAVTVEGRLQEEVMHWEHAKEVARVLPRSAVLLRNLLVRPMGPALIFELLWSRLNVKGGLLGSRRMHCVLGTKGWLGVRRRWPMSSGRCSRASRPRPHLCPQGRTACAQRSMAPVCHRGGDQRRCGFRQLQCLRGLDSVAGAATPCGVQPSWSAGVVVLLVCGRGHPVRGAPYGGLHNGGRLPPRCMDEAWFCAGVMVS